MLNVENKHGSTPERGWWLSDPTSDRKGFGVVMHQKNGNWIVARTLKGSPAEAAGVVSGDHLVSVDKYAIGLGQGEMTELYSLISIDTSSSNHELIFNTNSEQQVRTIEKRHLHDLLSFDYDHGGNLLGACVGCKTCRPLTIGATDCSSGCPGNYCTVG